MEATGSTIRNLEDSKLHRGNVFPQPANLRNLDARLEWRFGFADSPTSRASASAWASGRRSDCC